MDKKEALKKYLEKYGEVDALKDISSILQELSQEWKESSLTDNVKLPIVYALSDASFKLADASSSLEIANNHWVNNNSTEADKEADKYEALQLELDNHVKFFNNLSTKELAKLYRKNRNTLIAKLKRIEFLKKQMQSRNDRKKD